MAIEIKDPQLNINPEIYTTGGETPVVETLPPVTQVEVVKGLSPAESQRVALDPSLDEVISDGKVGFDSPEVKAEVSTAIASVWNKRIAEKVQGGEIEQL